MQDDLFGAPPAPPPAAQPSARLPARARNEVLPASHDGSIRALAHALPARLRLGTSSWSYPGWAGLVWDREYDNTLLSRSGLTAYAQHPLLRSVCIDRGFYRPLTEAQYAKYAAQVPDDFRFVVKAPALVTDAQVRDEEGKGRQANPAFLDPVLAVQEFIAPALAGLGHKVGALVFQISPLPFLQLQRLPLLLERLRLMLKALPDVRAATPDGVIAVEMRDPEWLDPSVAPALAGVLKEAGVTYCLGLHAKMPRMVEQLPLLRALWPGPMVCRWNLNPLHGAYGYEQAQREYSPYDRIQDVDEDTRALIVRTACAIAGAGQNVYVTISNKAEGCAPLSALALAQGVATHLGADLTPPPAVQTPANGGDHPA